MHSARPTFATLLLCSAIVACAHPTSEPIGGAPASAYFDEVWAQFDAHYAFFDLGAIDWMSYRTAYRDSVATATSDREVARLIGGMIGRLRDYHADLSTPFGSFGPPRIPYEHHYSAELVQRSYLAEPLRRTASQRIAFARMNDGAGYVAIPSFEGSGWGAEIEEALAGLGQPSLLVIDIRDNGGGNEDVGLDVAARFADRSRPYRVTRYRNGPAHGDFAAPSTMSLSPAGTRRFSGPIALITNRFNGSAAEDFTLMMRALPNVVTVGDTTLGAASNPLHLTLRNGWTYRVPQSMQSTPDGFVYQWRGLPPARAVAWSATDTAAGRDPYLDIALSRLAR